MVKGLMGIASETFRVGRHQCALYFYPYGKDLEDNSIYVSVFIALVSDGTNVCALIKFTLLDLREQRKHFVAVENHYGLYLKDGPHTFKNHNNISLVSMFSLFNVHFQCFNIQISNRLTRTLDHWSD